MDQPHRAPRGRVVTGPSSRVLASPASGKDRLRHRAGQLLALLLAGGIVGCGDSLKPSDLVGSYFLGAIQGGSPPKLIVDDPDCQITVTGGQLVLNADASFTMQLDEVTACPTPTQPGEVSVNWFGNYRLEGTTLVLTAMGDVNVEYTASAGGPTLQFQVEPPYGQLLFDSGRLD
jgi:hypothetical protein